jgi:NADPH-dependent curcumin reductase CurA
MEGFIVLDYYPRAQEAVTELADWIAQGKLKDRVDVQHGLENAPAALRPLFLGRNQGKQLLRVAN